MLKIRLTRVGKKNSPSFRVVVAEQKKAVMRKFIEIIGNYNPSLKPKQLIINKERALHWIAQGAQPSDTVRNLMCDLEILPKKDKVNIVYGKSIKKKDAKKKGDEEPVKKVIDEETVAENSSEEAAEQIENSEIAEGTDGSDGKEEVEVASEEPTVEEASEETVTEEAPVEEK